MQWSSKNFLFLNNRPHSGHARGETSVRCLTLRLAVTSLTRRSIIRWKLVSRRGTRKSFESCAREAFTMVLLLSIMSLFSPQSPSGCAGSLATVRRVSCDTEMAGCASDVRFPGLLLKYKWQKDYFVPLGLRYV